jgi:hypothetical protein
MFELEYFFFFFFFFFFFYFLKLYLFIDSENMVPLLFCSEITVERVIPRPFSEPVLHALCISFYI